MSRILLPIAVLLLLLSATVTAQQQSQSTRPLFTGGLQFGYNSGPGLSAFGMASNVASGFPMNLRLSLGLSTVNPGLSAEARRVFINDATNGIPEKSGKQTDFRFDIMYPVQLLNLKRAYLLFGPRHVRFTANFKYIGGNEDFDVTSNQWGVGTGVESFFSVSTKLDLVLHVGLDYYFESALTGHDTQYSPDGDDSNPRDGYSYEDADEAINQPKFAPRVMLGLGYKF